MKRWLNRRLHALSIWWISRHAVRQLKAIQVHDGRRWMKLWEREGWCTGCEPDVCAGCAAMREEGKADCARQLLEEARERLTLNRVDGPYCLECGGARGEHLREKCLARRISQHLRGAPL